MSRKKDIDLDLTGFAELFMNDEGRAESRLPRIYDIPLSEIDDFPNHPFKVKMDEDMNQLVQSVKERGVITPITLRQKEDGRYEIVSGHRRRKACELAGLECVPAEIKELSRDEAIILMVESNLQRSIILPSEKAFSYKMRLEAMKRQGQRTDLTSTPVVSKSRSNEELGEQIGESREQVRRYIRLTELIPELLDMVDENKIAFRPAVELSYLTETEQHNLLNSISYNDATPSLPQAIRLKEFSKAGKLSAEVIEAILGEEKPNQKEKISFKAERVELPAMMVPDEIKDNLVDAIYACQNGVMRMIPTIPDTVETSSNLAIVSIGGGKAEIKILARSSRDSMKDYLNTALESCFSMAGMEVIRSGGYSGWEPNVDSPILKAMKESYQAQFGKEPAVKVIHAGLECGIIGAVVPGLDMISFGPTLRSPHSPDERCFIPSVGKFYDFVVATLENTPVKE